MMRQRSRNLSRLLVVALLFGVICGGAVPAPGATLAGRAEVTPWSGWWWPKQAGSLVWGYGDPLHPQRQRPSPVEKYDLYTKGAYPLGPAFTKAADGAWYDPGAESWQGFCNGWVNAAILETEPAADSVLQGIWLKVGDKKGLLAACHAEDIVNYRPCISNPAVFHRFLLEYVGEKKQPIGADLDSSEEFWSFPIYAYEMEISPGYDRDRVTCTIHFANDFVDFDYVGCAARQRTYTYALDKNPEGEYTGTGTWLQGEPGDLHPEWVWVPVGIDQEKLFVDYRRVAEMAHSRGGDFRGPEVVPGHHLLLLAPGDSRELVVRVFPGERISCRLALDRQVGDSETAEALLEREGVEISRLALGRDLQELVVDGGGGGEEEYHLRISAAETNRKTLAVHLVADSRAENCVWHYGIPDSRYWLGCGVANSGPAQAEGTARLEVVDQRGFPLGCGVSARLAAGESWLEVVEKEVPVDYNFGSGPPVAVKLVSSFTHSGLFLAGDGETLQGDPRPGPRRLPERRRMAVPWLASSMEMFHQGTFYLHNPGTETVDAELAYYRNNGAAASQGRVSLAGGEVAEFKKGKYPGQASLTGWVLVTTDGELRGSVSRRNRRLDTADSLPLLSFGRQWLAPHVAGSAGWQTRLGVCNPNSGSLTIGITPVIDGVETGSRYDWRVDPHAAPELLLRGELFGLDDAALDRAWLKLESRDEFAGYVEFSCGGVAQASMPLFDYGRELAENRILSPMAVADGWWTGVVLVNAGDTGQPGVKIRVLDSGGTILQEREIDFAPLQRLVVSLAELFPGVDPHEVASIELEKAGNIRALTLFGAYYGTQELAAECW